MISKLNLKLCLLAAVLATNFAFAQQATVEVIADATREVKPVKVKIEAYVQSREGSSEKAKDYTSNKMEKVLAFIEQSKGIGMPRITAIRVKPRWSVINEKYEYTSMQYVSFEIDSLLAYEDLLEGILSKGLSGVSDIEYIIKNSGDEKNALLGTAYNNAKEKARSLASQMGMSLGNPVSVVEVKKDVENMDYIAIDPNLMSDMILPDKVVMVSTVQVKFAVN